MSFRQTFVLSLVLLSLPLTAAAQAHPNYVEGFSPDGVYQRADVDQINVFNGSLRMSIPIGQRYQVDGKLSYGLALYYTGRVWHLWERCENQAPYTCYTWATPNGRSNGGGGWLLSLGRLVLPMSGTNNTNYHAYESPTGLESGFHPTMHPGDTATAGVFYTRDGTYLRLKDLGTGYHEVEFPDDTIHKFESSSGKLTQMRDRSGNWVNITYPDSLTTQISDKHGRTHYIRFVTSARAAIQRVELEKPGGSTRAEYTFSYTDTTIERSAEDTDPASSTHVNMNLLTSVGLPDGSSYQMSYRTTNSTTTTPDSGFASKVTLPTLGSVNWTYQSYPLTSALSSRVAGVKTRALANASGTTVSTWNYATQKDSLSPTRELKNTLTTPRGDVTEHFFSIYQGLPSSGWTAGDYGLPFTRNATDGTSPGRLLSTRTYTGTTTLARTGFVRYERDGPCDAVGCSMGGNRRVVSTRTTYNDDGSRYAITDYSSFDGLGHYRQATTSGNFDSGNARTTFTNYNPLLGTYSLNADGTRASGYTMLPNTSAWVINTYTDQSATENSVTAKSLYCWNGGTGLLLRQRTMTGTTPAGNDVVKINAYSAGNLVNEYLYGGDLQALATTDLCSTSFTGHQSALVHTW